MTATVDADVLRVSVPATEGANITRTLAAAGLYLSELRPDEVDLETVFLELTKGESGDAR
jgi:hypothetical protein